MHAYRFQSLCEQLCSLTSADWRQQLTLPFCPDEVVRSLAQFQSAAPGRLHLHNVGESYEGRPIQLARIGEGPTKVLMWSQMHGDEPTHTTVLLDLLHCLTQAPDHPAINQLLSHCTLEMIPMLNPDGAVRNTRRNSQGIDINRDAKAVQSPEGRILRDAVLRFQPDFGFNLHNHNPRRTVAATGALAAVALLAPPADASGNEPDHLIRAQQIGSCFCHAVLPHCADMMWRYGADYMPRAFGEWIQGQGVSTLLIEAGGWPGADKTPLLDIHFRGLTAALLAIATEEYCDVGTDLYERLPRGEGFDRLDCIVRNARLSADTHECYVSDVGIHQAASAGTIVDTGDLSVHNADIDLDAQHGPCSPGRWAICNRLTTELSLSSERTMQLLRRGITTIVGLVDAERLAEVDFEARWTTFSHRPSPLNLALAFECNGSTSLADVLVAVALGATALTFPAGFPPDPSILCFATAVQLQQFELPDSSYSASNSSDTILGAPTALQIGSPADLFWTAGNDSEIKHVVVAGQLALRDGVLTGHRSGRFLNRELAMQMGPLVLNSPGGQ